MSENTSNNLAEDHVATICRFRPPRNASPSSWSIDQYATELEKFSAVLGPTATNEDLFNKIGKQLVDEMLQGKNVTILASGQTGAGKSHSIYASNINSNFYNNNTGIKQQQTAPTTLRQEDPGLLPRCVEYLFSKCNANKRAMRFRVSVSIVEVYKEEIRDLMSTPGNTSSSSSAATTSSSSSLQMREKNEVFFLPDVNVKVCTTSETLLREVTSAFANRTTGNSYLSDVSSRAHAVATISIAAETNVRGSSSPVLLLSRMSFVDLCGNEVLTDKFGAEQQSETKSINKSLFALRGVISALAERANFVPYRDAVLTKLLKATLTRDSMNVIICCCSPDPEDTNLTLGTISFGQTAQRIEQNIVKRIFTREKGAAGGGKIKMKDEADETTIKLEDLDNAAKAKKQNSASDGGGASTNRIFSTRITIPTRQGEISALFFAKEGILPEQTIAAGKVGIALHAFGGGCCGQDMFVYSAPAIENGSVDGVFSVDMPGFGVTNGARQTSRTDSLWNEGGPMEIVVDVLEHVTEKKKTRQVLFFAWDWGANMALSLAVSAFKNRVRALVLFHPSWTSPHEQLAPVKVPVIMLWNPNDTLHLIAHGRKMAKIMAKSKLVAIKPKAGTRGRESYDENFNDIIASQIDLFTKTLPAASTSKATATSKPDAQIQQQQQQQQQQQTVIINDSSSSSSDDDDDLDMNIKERNKNDENDEDELASLDEMSDFSRESSFLSLLLIDPEVVDAAVANERSKTLRRQDKSLRSEVDADPSSQEIFAKLSSLKQPANGIQGASRDRVREIVNTISSICNANTKTRLALAYALLGRNNPLKSSIIGALGLLPNLLPYSSALTFQSLGYLDVVPRGANSPSWSRSRLYRYLPGRTVMVGLPADLVNQDMREPTTLGCLLKGVSASTLQSKLDKLSSSANRFYSFRCRIVGLVSETVFRAEIESEEDHAWVPFNVTLAQLEKMNAPTNFPKGPGNFSLIFEDAIRGRYDNLVLRTKLAQCCQSIAAFIPQMDFDAAWNERCDPASSSAAPKNNELLSLQIKCVEALRNCVDIHHHVARGKDPNRALVPDVGALATFGQFHCHGLASAFSAILLPFSSLIGMDVRQRDGFWAKDKSGGWDGSPLRSADHTWCEVTFHPSGANFVSDPSYAPKFGDEIVAKYRDVYSACGCRYPTRDLVCAGDSRVLFDAKQCYLLHEDVVASASVNSASAKNEINSMKKLIWNDETGKLSFI